MCCIALTAGFAGPRIAFVLVWIFTDLVNRAFDTFWWPLLGVIVLPWTTLLFVLAYSPITGVSGFGIFVVLLGVLADIATYASGARGRSYS